MEEKMIEESVKELIEDLKNKVDTLTQSADEKDDEIARKADAIRNKAISVFNDASEKLKGMLEETRSDEEVLKAIDTVKTRSRQLFDSAVEKISALKEEVSRKEETAEEKPAQKQQVTDTADLIDAARKGIDEIIGNVGDEINEFVNREDVKTAVEKTKEGVIDVAEKALEILKGWLAPESEDK